MTITNTEGDAWATFKREFALDDWPTPPQHAADGATLAPLRAEVERLGAGRPRKQPPVPVADGEQYCWSCQSVLPAASFTVDRSRAAPRLNCRKCDGTARARRKREQAMRAKSQPTDGGGLSAIQ